MWFYKPEWEKGCDVRGETFKALYDTWMPVCRQAEGFKVPHMKRGMLSMDRHETQALTSAANDDFTAQDYQGSVFFITLKDFS